MQRLVWAVYGNRAAAVGDGERPHRLAADITRDLEAGERVRHPLLDLVETDVVDQHLAGVADIEVAVVAEAGGVKRLVDALVSAHVVLDLLVDAVGIEEAGGAIARSDRCGAYRR